MDRRAFITSGIGASASHLSRAYGFGGGTRVLDAAWFHRSRRFAGLSHGRIAYVQYGRGRPVLFLHGFPLNGFEWRGAIHGWGNLLGALRQT